MNYMILIDMDYEKKYNEMKHRVYEIGAGIAEGIDYSKPRQIADYICPEFHESEDDRIRKEIVGAIQKHYPNTPESYRWIAYLEKQKEPKPADGWDYADNRMSHPLYLEGFEAGRAVERELSEFEKQKEEKLDSIRIKCKEHDERREEIRVTEIIESIIRVYGKTQGEFIAGYDVDTLIHWVRKAFDCLNKQNIQKEQKPIEPSDDELQRHQDELYDFKVFAAKQAKEHHISFVHVFEWNNFCAELLSYFNEQKPIVSLDTMLSKDPHLPKQAIKDEQKPTDYCSVRDEFDLDGNLKQKPAEWSEEDEKKLGQVISGRYLPLGLHEWFCGLPERFPSRPSWKPSEEQMKALKKVTGNAVDADEYYPALATLYYELKEQF